MILLTSAWNGIPNVQTKPYSTTQQATTSTSKAPAAQFRRGKAGYEVLRVNLRTMSTYQAPRFSQCYQVAIYIYVLQIEYHREPGKRGLHDTWLLAKYGSWDCYPSSRLITNLCKSQVPNPKQNHFGMIYLTKHHL